MAPLTDNMRGAVFMMASMAGFCLNDTLVKIVSADLPLFQSVFLRGLMATALVAGLAAAQGALRFRPVRRDGRLIAQRVVGEIGGTICFLTALFEMPLANVSAILQSVPLAVTFGAALFLGETVGWRRYAAIAVGFVGVLVIVRPGAEGFDSASLWAVASIGFIVLRDLSTRSLSGGPPAAFVVLVTSLAMTLIVGVAAALTEWRPFDGAHLLALAGAAFCLVTGYVFGVQSMRTGEIGFTQPFRYTLLIWAILLGALVFGEWPDVWMLLGSAIVAGAGLYTFYRERQLRRPVPSPLPPA